MPSRWKRVRTRVSLLSICFLSAAALAITFSPQKPATSSGKPAVARKFKFERTKARLERGRYLVEHVSHCFLCHSDVDWKGTGRARPGTQGGGGRIPDDALPFPVYAPNISPDPETGAGNWADEQFERALRQGIGDDGRLLFPFMPYYYFRGLSDEDLASIIVYVRSIPPVRHKVPRTQWPKELLELFKPLPPLSGPVPPADPHNRVQRGQYLVSIAACDGCHTPVDEKFQPLPGLTFGGGAALWGTWGRVSSPNLTPDPSGIPHYDEAMFLKTIRAGAVNGVRPLNHIMPWKYFRGMADGDLKAIFAYLRTLKPVMHRVDNTEPATFCRLCRGTHGFGNRN